MNIFGALVTELYQRYGTGMRFVKVVGIWEQNYSINDRIIPRDLIWAVIYEGRIYTGIQREVRLGHTWRDYIADT